MQSTEFAPVVERSTAAEVALGASAGTRTLYDRHRAASDSHNQALRIVANRLVGILHGRLESHTPCDEDIA